MLLDPIGLSAAQSTLRCGRPVARFRLWRFGGEGDPYIGHLGIRSRMNCRIPATFSRPAEYDEAAQIVDDLWTLAQRDGRQDSVRQRLVELRTRYAPPSCLDALAIPSADG